MAEPGHLTLRRLLTLWEIESAEAGHSGLGRLSSRDLEYFSTVFKDSFVARGAPAGPFRLSFVGTNLEAHIGRKMINVVVGDCFGRASAAQLSANLVEAARRARPLYAELTLSSSSPLSSLAGELLCLPFVEAGGADANPMSDTATIFGTLAVAGFEELPPEPTHRELSILTMAII